MAEIGICPSALNLDHTDAIPGILASIIGLAAIGCRLSSRLNAVGCDIASAGVETLSISKGVTIFSLILKQVGQALQAADSVHSSEALETAQQIANECKLVFDEIEEKLDKVTTKRADGSMAPSIQQRFKWCFKKGRLQYLLTRLESLKMDLLVMLQILQMGKLMAATSNRYVDQYQVFTISETDLFKQRAKRRNCCKERQDCARTCRDSEPGHCPLFAHEPT